MSVAPDPTSSPLCRLEDLSDPGSKGFELSDRRLFAVRHDKQIFVYENRCPHRGIPLEWVPDQFLDTSGQLIQCASHGALFLPESGECVAGPCAGAHLTPVPSHQDSDGRIWLD